MPFIPQWFLDCSVYLYPSKQSAENGENFGGSGCLVSVLSEPVEKHFEHLHHSYQYVRRSAFPPHIYVVTNKHVARKGYPVVRLNTVDGRFDILNLDHNDWIPHPEGDDLAVAPIELPADKHHYFPIDADSFVRRGDLYSDKPSYKFVVGAGDDTFMVGRFINHGGKQRNTPSVRFGSIAMLPFEKVKLGEAADFHMQEGFLVETRSISGFSGSPVFVYSPTTSEYVGTDGWESEGITDLVGEPRLLGIDCGHVPKYEKVLTSTGQPHPNGWKIASNTGLAIVIPAWRLDLMLNMPELVMKREQKNTQHKKQQEQEETAVMDVEEEPFTAESYQDALKRASSRVSERESEKTQTSE
jgi:hypothetical protein